MLTSQGHVVHDPHRRFISHVIHVATLSRQTKEAHRFKKSHTIWMSVSGQGFMNHSLTCSFIQIFFVQLNDLATLFTISSHTINLEQEIYSCLSNPSQCWSITKLVYLSVNKSSWENLIKLLWLNKKPITQGQE